MRKDRNEEKTERMFTKESMEYRKKGKKERILRKVFIKRKYAKKEHLVKYR